MYDATLRISLIEPTENCSVSAGTCQSPDEVTNAIVPDQNEVVAIIAYVTEEGLKTCLR